jgi:uncharacterized membrane protein YphA (DoxX/SURF4 family)
VSVVLWIFQIVLAVVFLLAGFTKVSQPKEKLASTMSWVEDYSGNSVRYISVLEILGGLGLVLPWVTGIARLLTPLAGFGLAAIQIGAMATHARRKEYPMIVVNVVLAVLALIVAVARLGDL